jgi:hypothetical protein
VTRVFGLVVRAEDSRAITAEIKANITPGSFSPFILCPSNEMTLKRYEECSLYKQQYIVFYNSLRFRRDIFKLENSIKVETLIERIIMTRKYENEDYNRQERF